MTGLISKYRGKRRRVAVEVERREICLERVVLQQFLTARYKVESKIVPCANTTDLLHHYVALTLLDLRR